MTTGEAPDHAYATAEEIGEAIEMLTEAELGRIHRAAQYALFGTEYTDPLELLGEAVQRTLEGVGVKEGRHWPKDVHFVAYIIRTMQSIAEGSSSSITQSRTTYLETMAGREGDAESALAREGFHSPDVVEQALEIEETKERQARAVADAALIDAHFANDEEIQFLIMGDKDGMKPSEIRAVSGMDQTAYDTARRRFRRGLNTLMPGRRKL
ncbi:hypothetical protein [Burkholderia vietnamiensis]|uniref:hypothetical protein n=1 Tax=Burkholderia vietnamiensis TaxID=60552 RepID=UPI001FC8C688|nr:hypothetical protein [Burkholderia vietnamiensis]